MRLDHRPFLQDPLCCGPQPAKPQGGAPSPAWTRWRKGQPAIAWRLSAWRLGGGLVGAGLMGLLWLAPAHATVVPDLLPDAVVQSQMLQQQSTTPSVRARAKAPVSAGAATRSVLLRPDRGAASQQNDVLLRLNDSTAPGALGQALEQQQGEALLREINRQLPVIDDWLVQQELQAIVDRLVAVARMPAPMTVLVVHDATLNAFAVPGSVIAVNSGLILRCRTVDELAGVLAHELAHVHQRHFERRMQELKQTRWLVLGGLLAGVAATRAEPDSDLGAAVFTGTQALATDRQLAFGRAQEQEADRIGLQLLQGAGFDPQAMADFFELMDKNQALPRYIPDFVLTHPLTRERLSDMRQRVAMLPRQAGDSAVQQRFDELKGWLSALTWQTSSSELQARRARSDADTLTLALLLGRQHQHAAAQAQLAPLLTRHRNVLAVQAAQLQLLLGQQQDQPSPDLSVPMQQALGRLKHQWPNQPVTRWFEAKVALAQGHADAAIMILQGLTRDFPHQRSGWAVLEQAATQARRPAAEVLRYRAERLNGLGDLDGAIVALERAEKLASQAPPSATQANLLSDVRARLAHWRAARKQTR